jgi:anti-sigma factor RsiW
MGNPCQDESTLSAYMDGALSEHHAQSIRRHIADCERCRQRLADLKAADAMIQGLKVHEPSADFERTFWRKVEHLQMRDSDRRWTRWLYPVWRPALATGLAVGLAMAVFILNGLDNGVDIEDRFIAEHIELLGDYDLLQNLEILENWDAIDAMKELS